MIALRHFYTSLREMQRIIICKHVGSHMWNRNNIHEKTATPTMMKKPIQLRFWLRNLWSLDHQELPQDALQLRRWHRHQSVVCLNTQLEECNPCKSKSIWLYIPPIWIYSFDRDLRLKLAAIDNIRVEWHLNQHVTNADSLSDLLKTDPCL